MQQERVLHKLLSAGIFGDWLWLLELGHHGCDRRGQGDECFRDDEPRYRRWPQCWRRRRRWRWITKYSCAKLFRCAFKFSGLFLGIFWKRFRVWRLFHSSRFLLGWWLIAAIVFRRVIPRIIVGLILAALVFRWFLVRRFIQSLV